MVDIKGKINGLNAQESKEFLDLMRSIDGVECDYWLQEGIVEFKAIFTPIIISILQGVSVSLIAKAIYNFLKKKKEEGKKVSINIGTINIYQNDNLGEINNKIGELQEGAKIIEKIEEVEKVVEENKECNAIADRAVRRILGNVVDDLNRGVIETNKKGINIHSEKSTTQIKDINIDSFLSGLDKEQTDTFVYLLLAETKNFLSLLDLEELRKLNI